MLDACIVPLSEKLYGAVPPVAVTVIIAEPPLHKIALLNAELATNKVGSVTEIVVVLVHAFTSVTVYV